MLLWADGQVAEADAVGISPMDRGLTLGDGLFETMLWTGKRIARLHDHLERLNAGVEWFGFPAPVEADTVADAAIALTCALGHNGAGVLRMMLTRGPGPRGLPPPPRDDQRPRLILTLAPCPPPLPPAQLVTVSIRRNPTAPSARFKTISYIDQVAALAEAKAGGGDEALMLGPSGQLACASAANLWVCRRGEWTTPRVEDGAMPGVTRRSAIRYGLCETTLTPGDLLKCDAAALTNAVVGMCAIASVDGAPIPQDPAAFDTLRNAIRDNPTP